MNATISIKINQYLQKATNIYKKATLIYKMKQIFSKARNIVIVNIENKRKQIFKYSQRRRELMQIYKYGKSWGVLLV